MNGITTQSLEGEDKPWQFSLIEGYVVVMKDYLISQRFLDFFRNLKKILDIFLRVCYRIREF